MAQFTTVLNTVILLFILIFPVVVVFAVELINEQLLVFMTAVLVTLFNLNYAHWLAVQQQEQLINLIITNRYWIAFEF